MKASTIKYTKFPDVQNHLKDKDDKVKQILIDAENEGELRDKGKQGRMVMY